MNALDWVKTLVPPLVDLVGVLADDAYDEEAEEQAILDFQRKLSDARARRKFGVSSTEPPST